MHMLSSSFIFYQHDAVIEEMDDDKYKGHHPVELKVLVRKLAIEMGATKVVNRAFYHNHQRGVEQLVYNSNLNVTLITFIHTPSPSSVAI